MADSKSDNQNDFVISKNLDDEETEDYHSEDFYGNHTGIFKKKTLSPIVLGGVGFIVLVILFMLIFFRPGNVVGEERLQTLEARIQQLESKLATIGVIDQALDRLAEQEQKFSLLNKRLDRLEGTTKTQIDQIIKELSILHQKTAGKPLPKVGAPQTTAPAKKEIKTKFHQVRAGETLYRISQRYGLTVDQLRRYNNIDSKATIQPGQKLRLTPTGGQQ